MPRVIHFEIPADNLEPALEFYKVGSLINGKGRRIIGSSPPERENRASVGGLLRAPPHPRSYS
jgi:predicted enzyme related to lactoylglutathione lyase